MLNLDAATIVFQIINFLVLVYLLNRFLFQPILRQAAERAAEKERLMKKLAAERQEVAQLRAELEEKQMQMQEVADKVVQETRERAEAERNALLKEARQEAELLLVQAQSDVLRLQQQALTDFQEQLVTAILDISGNVVLRVAPPEAHDALVRGLNESIRELGREEMQRVEALRRSLGTREPVAYTASARELSAEQEGQLARILTALADRHVNIELTTDPSLVAGLRVRLGDTVMDNSIAGQLQELRDDVLGTLKERFNGA